MGCLADKLVQTESQSTLDFIGPLCNLPTYRKKMTQIIPGIYCIGETHLRNFTEQEITAINKVTHKDATSIYTFSKLYFHDTIFHSCHKEERKRDSSNCCFISDGAKQFGVIQTFCFSLPLVLLKPYNKTNCSLLKSAGNPGRDRLKEYAKLDPLSTFFVEVDELLQVCAIPIASLLSKCVFVSSKNMPCSYVIPVPNNFEHH